MKMLRLTLVFVSVFFFFHLTTGVARIVDDVSIREGDILVYHHEIEDQGLAHDFALPFVPANSRIEISEIHNDYINEKVKIGKTRWDRTEKVSSKEDGLLYGFPLRVGLKWGQDPAMPKRNDNMYCYYVERMENVTVPAGTFKSCFKIIYDTCPDTNTEWYCPGVGIVKSEYHHHGTITNELVELAKIVHRGSK
ncbi:MAG: hypothetical protein COS99_00160 [Candidatus Omnitrophica bacterium CG07_land_8_20_14_0_80_42_15]|uniref:DUF3108 domain-containing protein n=1 Tax=Candidatus Aquitaenariimonas noxiae TaxID=1974741 RepID=A0A2J0KXG1_9BACT|nr:MAG: hypothetical protein COS99_00160 [Candidatus Omnitrophica bacterium CG07_land_8_20_14_0_80_42_15]